MTHSAGRLLCAITLSAAFTAAAPAADWPQWRGPDRTDISKETNLLKDWTSQPPKLLWLLKDGGKGYSGFSTSAGKLYTMRATDSGEELLCLDENSGKVLWTAPVGKLLTNKWGDGPRATPTIDGDKVYTMGGQGDLICADANTGKVAWKASMTALGGKVPGWGYCESVLVDGPLVICTPGGKEGAIAALDKKTGKVVWRSKEFTDGAQYASVVPASINGVHQYVQLTMNAVVGVDAKTGKLLWKADWPGKTAVIPTPIVRDNHVYVTSGYGVGCMLVKIGPKFQVEKVYENKEMKNHHGGVILVGDHLYGYSDGPGWICQEFLTGKMVWAEKKLGKGAIACADGMLYLLDEQTGTVALIEASPAGYKEHGRFTLEPQTEIRSPSGRIWTHPVISNGKLFLRDQDLIFAFDVTTDGSATKQTGNSKAPAKKTKK